MKYTNTDLKYLRFLIAVEVLLHSNLKVNLGLGREDRQQAVIDEFLCALWLVVRWEQMYVIGC